MVALCFTCALILSALSSALREPQQIAEELNRNQEMLIAAKIFNPKGYFQLRTPTGEYLPAKYNKDGMLVPGTENDLATSQQVFEVSKARIHSFLVDERGERTSFEEQNIDTATYVLENKKTGYGHLPYKLVYEISPNGVRADAMAKRGVDPDGYIFAVNGFGLWDAIFGYLAIEPDGKTVRGIAWYEHKETPGLGANITNPAWQKNFAGKQLFQKGAGTMTIAPLGISVIRGKVIEVYPNNPKGDSAVDGMAGATLTGNGVTKAYKESLKDYRNFLISLNENSMKISKS
jgi:Na+-transporting NADH:ubiquinone oxidoreductase subunit C